MVFDLLTEKDKHLINSRRIVYGYNIYNNMCNIEKFLKPWNEAKSTYLEKFFKDKLIIKIPIDYKESKKDRFLRLHKLLATDANIIVFKNELRFALNKNISSVQDKNGDVIGGEIDIFDINYLSENRFSEYLKINFKDGSCIVINENTKPIKIITKLAMKFNIGTIVNNSLPKAISDLEYFRQRHSLGLNQKAFKGNLCLSIHPLDYMTLSDNVDKWESCLSWNKPGCHRQGTIEMMNSNSAVIGYLESDKKTMICGEGAADLWNSKKWRSLFLVDPNFIVSIKGYPYTSEQLSKICIEQLAKLSGWDSIEIQEFRNNQELEFKNGLMKIYFNTNMGHMYNDFGMAAHYMAIKPKGIIMYNTDYNYCGTSECIWCGKTEACNFTDKTLCCDECEEPLYCDECGAEITGEDIVTDDYFHVCEDCYETYVYQDCLTNKSYYEINAFYIKDSDDDAPIWFYISNETMSNEKIMKQFFKNGKDSLKQAFGEKNFNLYYQYLVDPSELTEDGKKMFQ